MMKKEDKLFCLNQLKILNVLSDGKEHCQNSIAIAIKKQAQQIKLCLSQLRDYGLINIIESSKNPSRYKRYKIQIPKESMKDVKTIIRVFSKNIKL